MGKRPTWNRFSSVPTHIAARCAFPRKRSYVLCQRRPQQPWLVQNAFPWHSALGQAQNFPHSPHHLLRCLLHFLFCSDFSKSNRCQTIISSSMSVTVPIQFNSKNALFIPDGTESNGIDKTHNKNTCKMQNDTRDMTQRQSATCSLQPSPCEVHREAQHSVITEQCWHSSTRVQTLTAESASCIDNPRRQWALLRSAAKLYDKTESRPQMIEAC